MSDEEDLVPLSAEEYARWGSLHYLFERPAAKNFAPAYFEPGKEVLQAVQQENAILVVGAGGLGCEILKNLALSGVKNIEVVDMDTIDVSNLNRQFLFREKDVKAGKAATAAAFVMKRVPGVTIKAHNCRIQKFTPEDFKRFNVVISGLDNLEARRWLNKTLCDLVDMDEETGQPDPSSIIPFIDGGTEGFDGQARVFVPRLSACFECSMAVNTPPRGFPVCTIASVPRLPEHCVAYAKDLLWPLLKTFKSCTDYTLFKKEDKPEEPLFEIDTDDLDHMSWLFFRAAERAKEFNIRGVTLKLTQQVVKNIIPAIASTNALISAAVCSEAMKVISVCSASLNNWWQYMAKDGIAPQTFEYQRNPTCLACGSTAKSLKVQKDITVGGFLDLIKSGDGLGKEIMVEYLERSVEAPLTAGKKLITRRVAEDDQKEDTRDHLKGLTKEYWSLPNTSAARQKFLRQYMTRSQGSTVYTLPNKPENVLDEPQVPSSADELFTLLQIKTVLEAPSLEADKVLYLSGVLAASYKDNLPKKLSEFVESGGSVFLTDAKAMGETRVDIKLTFES